MHVHANASTALSPDGSLQHLVVVLTRAARSPRRDPSSPSGGRSDYMKVPRQAPKNPKYPEPETMNLEALKGVESDFWAL